jgi:hypothetical protein
MGRPFVVGRGGARGAEWEMGGFGVGAECVGRSCGLAWVSECNGLVSTPSVLFFNGPD